MTTGGSTLVSSPSSERVLRSAAKSPAPASATLSAKDHNLQDVALVEAEEKMMDEEITSIEDNHEEISSVEHHLVTTALVESSRDKKKCTGETSIGDLSSEGADCGGSKEVRYGLRKRRRPTGQALQLLEHYQSSKDGGLMRTHPASAPVLATESSILPAVKEKLDESPPQKMKPIEAPSQELKCVTTLPDKEADRPPSRLDFSTDNAPQPAVLSQNHIPIEQAKPNAVSHKQDSMLPMTSSVPNPLLQFVDEMPSLVSVAAPHSHVTEASATSSSVPCPLLGTPIADNDPASSSLKSSFSANAKIDEITKTRLPVTFAAATSAGRKKKTSSTAPKSFTQVATLTRTLDQSGKRDEGDKSRKVTINDTSSHPGSRIRGFSIDMDLGLDFADLGSSNSTAAESQTSRDRAFSFECFAFGINADEPLPPIEQSVSSTGSYGRPRGDSIIFDPTSFQEGGIHEQNALEKPRGPSVAKATQPKPSQAVGLHPGSTMKPPTKPSTKPSTKPPAATSLAETVIKSKPPLPSRPPPTPAPTPEDSSLLVNSATPGLSLDLVNKDGRIGIYLPEARRARIARFHAKRASRIWRKRIKYDCRKKLADSRPRIKGRFVKRTDMDDE